MTSDKVLRCAATSPACSWLTTSNEARSRKFNTNGCAKCGAPLRKLDGSRWDPYGGDDEDEALEQLK